MTHVIVEKLILRKLFSNLLAAGYTVRLREADAYEEKYEQDALSLARTCYVIETEWVDVEKDGRTGWVRIVQGNGCDLISDYTTSPVDLDDVIEPINQWIERDCDALSESFSL